ncbi:MAG: fatty acyl-AMP ligase, partial [Deferrisomatales bacterium]
ASAWAAHLAGLGVSAGDRVLLILPTERAFYEAYWGILLAGAVPVPAYPPVRLGRIPQYHQSLAGLARNSGSRLLVTSEAVRPLVRPVADALEGGLAVAVPGDVAPGGARPAAPVAPSDLGLLQYTSGSTGAQKGVMLTHANLLANIRAFGAALELGADDVAVSWLPLYHDMGLIGLMLGSFYWGCPLVATSPIDFLRRPARWIRMLSEHRGTVSAGPNFAYSLVARKARDPDLEGVDLSAWRVALCGAEPIHPVTIDAFTRRFASRGLRPEAFFPAYGLAEATLAVTFSRLGRPARVEHLDAERLEAAGVAERVQAGGSARAVVSCGRPVPTVEVAVLDEAGRPVPEGVRGEVVVGGPSVMAGYFGNPEATARAMAGRWLRTGDLGFLLDGELFLSGRSKDLVIKAGRNYFAEDLEAAAAEVPGVRPGGLAVFAAENRDRGTEEVVLVAEVAEAGAPEGLADALRLRVADLTGCRPDRVVLVPPRTLPKTSSGKIQRYRARAWYLDGSLAARGGERRTAGAWTYLRAWLKDKLPFLRR